MTIVPKKHFFVYFSFCVPRIHGNIHGDFFWYHALTGRNTKNSTTRVFGAYSGRDEKVQQRTERYSGFFSKTGRNKY
jgi:hypothetical protein